jgi:ParB/RepB/Spo0J family partition protein
MAIAQVEHPPALIQLRPDELMPSPLNPRKSFPVHALDELAASLREFGIQQPIVARPAPYSNAPAPYEIIMGERRWRAAKIAGLGTIPAIVRLSITDLQLLEIALQENMQRQDLNPIEEAEAFERLKKMGMTQQTIARHLSKSQPWVANRIRLLQLPLNTQELIRRGDLNPSKAITLLTLPEPLKGGIEELAAAVVDQRMSSSEIRQAVNRLQAGQPVEAQLASGFRVAGTVVRPTPDDNGRVEVRSSQGIAYNALEAKVRALPTSEDRVIPVDLWIRLEQLARWMGASDPMVALRRIVDEALGRSQE